MDIDEVTARIEGKAYTPSDLRWLVKRARELADQVDQNAEVIADAFTAGYLEGFAKGNPAKQKRITFGRFQLESSRTLPDAEPSATDKLVAAVGLCGEAGEVADYIKKIEAHGHSLNSAKLAEEIGDVLWYVAAICTYYHIQLDDAAIGNIEKLKARYPDGFSHKASRERKDGT